MAKLVTTSKVDSHHTNPMYRCLLVDLMNDPTHHFEFKVNWEDRTIKVVKDNWMPTDDVMLDIVLRLAEESPTFRKKLYHTVSFW